MSVVVALPSAPRPKPPEADGLTDDERAEWNAITDKLPGDHFPREVHPLLAAYVRHIVAGRRVAGMIRVLEKALGQEVDEGRPTVDVVCESMRAMNRLLAMQDREGRAASSLATRLRLTPQSRKGPQQQAPPRDYPPPWERRPGLADDRGGH
jgi:hypothetical protein